FRGPPLCRCRGSRASYGSRDPRTPSARLSPRPGRRRGIPSRGVGSSRGRPDRSSGLLHRFEPADHRLDSAAYLLVLLQERRPLGDQRFLPLLEGCVFLAQLLAELNQLLETLLEALEFEVEALIRLVAHAREYRVRRARGSITAPRVIA